MAIPWTPFYWVVASADSFQFDYAGILLHLQVRKTGPQSLLQLDLSGSGNMPDGFPQRVRDSTPMPLRRRGQIYGLLGPGISRHLVGGSDSTRAHWQEDEIGTVGLPNYLINTLLLDFPNRRLATLPPSIDWTSVLGNFADTVSLEKGQRDEVIVPVGAPNGRVFRGLLDTGLSPFPLWTTQAIWQDLTGLGGPGATTRIYRIPNPAGTLVFIGAPLRIPLRIGTWKLRVPEVVFLAQGPDGAAPEGWQPPVDLVLGPAAFARTTVLAIDLAHARLGLAKRIAP